MIAFRDFSSSEYGRPEGLDRALVEANDIGLRIWYLVGPDTGAGR
jgi:hypothetical protein